jgi:excinuclease UvrABC helicase subunit UvrB
LKYNKPIKKDNPSPFGGLPSYFRSKQERMKLPKKLIHPKLSEQELIEILENLEKQKARVIKNQNYQRAAEIRDQERKYREQLEDLLNPPEEPENGHPEDQN